jgi:multiple sugar transport system permease protein
VFPVKSLKGSKKKKTGRETISDTIAGYVFSAPWIIGLFVFTLYPVLMSLYYSFTDYNLFSAPNFIGLDNFKRILFDDELFWTSIKVTLKYVLISVPLRLAFALFIAILLNQKRKLLGLYRVAFYLPSIVGGSIAIAIMWRQIFGTDGAIISILNLLGIDREYSFIGDPKTALGTLIILAVWQFGSSMLIFLAGLKNIPDSYYEAAVIDGANWGQKFFRITIPMLTPVIFFNLIMQTIGGFMSFTQSMVITKGGPMNKTLMTVLYVYQKGFEYFEMGYASSIAWILLAAIAIVTVFVFKSSPYWVFYEAKEDK